MVNGVDGVRTGALTYANEPALQAIDVRGVLGATLRTGATVGVGIANILGSLLLGGHYLAAKISPRAGRLTLALAAPVVMANSLAARSSPVVTKVWALFNLDLLLRVAPRSFAG